MGIESPELPPLWTNAGQAVFRPVRTGNAFEETMERLLQAIKLDVVGPGERLPAERELAGRLKVSRVTLREAIRALQEAGYVESRRGRYGGTFVNQTLPTPTVPMTRRSTDNLEDVLALRRVLEAGAAEMAAMRSLTSADRQHLRARLADTASSDPAEYRRKDSRLHLAIAEITASRSLTEAVADVRIVINDLLDTTPLFEADIAHSNAQHEVIVTCILSGDVDGARGAMAAHLDRTAERLRGLPS